MQIIEYLVKQLRESAAYNQASQVAPAAILWTDEAKQWQTAMPVIKQFLPELVELGDYNLATRTGPAIWLKCAIACVLDELTMPQGLTPIVYLPGVCRKDLRAIEHCPDFLKPLAELQYRGAWWAYNTAGRDWTVASFLTNQRVGLNLDLAKDNATQDAMLSVLPELLEAQVTALSNRRLEAADFQALVMADPVKDILAWLNEPAEKQRLFSANQWQIFSDLCQQQYSFLPEQGNINTVLHQLCNADGAWQAVWQRFCDTAHNLPKLVEQLETIAPQDLAAPVERYLAVNLAEEQELAKQLAGFSNLDANSARTKIIQLQQTHASRLDWVWAKLGFARWAQTLSELAKVAELTDIAFSGFSPLAMAEHYQTTYWQADAAALAAMALADTPTAQDTVAQVLDVIYTPWLEQVTNNFQQLVSSQGYPGDDGIQEAKATYQVKSQVVFFVDGLRFDTGQRLLSLLAAKGLNGRLKPSWAALPSLTATAKAAVTPISELLTGRQDNADFIPALAEQDVDFSSYQFKKVLKEHGWQYLEGLDTGETTGLAWLQVGDLDNLGHEMQRKLPLYIEPVLQEIVARVQGLLDAGWQHVRIVTDHGWLWAPSKLPTENMPEHIVKKRLARCAILKDNVDVGYLKCQWYWNKNVTLAMARGIQLFRGGDHYNHGGLSLQECLTPVLEISK